ncbi:manganese transporter, partial [Bacteroides thetaiotaomicron]|nr:manganese transporter [Bacteroides thetaiotaomicron]
IWVLVMLSIILTASVMYPDISGEAILDVLIGGSVFAIVGYLATVLIRRNKRVVEPGIDRSQRDAWRMPPLDTLEPQKMTLTTRV